MHMASHSRRTYGKLHAHLVWHRRTMRLVGFEEFVAKSGFAGVEHDADIIGFVVFNQAPQDIRKEKRHFGGNAAGRVHAHHGGVKGPIDVRHRVYKEEFFRGFFFWRHRASIAGLVNRLG